MIKLENHARGVVLSVRAQAGGRVNAIRGEQDGMLKVSVTQVPEKGKANKSIIELLTRSLGLRRSQVSILSGETSPQKKFLVEGVTPEELSARITAALSAA